VADGEDADVPLLQMSGVTKHYGGVRALDGASLSLEAGEVHGLLGPNGSGKSTLNKVLAGTVAADRAEITLDGRPLAIHSPRDAHRHGIAAVYQQLSLIPDLTVAQNLTLGVEPARAGFLRARVSAPDVAETLRQFAPALGDRVTASTPVADLPPGEQQIVEIAKAVMRRPRILILDEATASLHRDQVSLVFDVVRRLCAAGVSVAFVSHRIDEVMQLCTRATILRSGRTVASTELAGTSEQELVSLMIGQTRAPEAAAAPRAEKGEPRLTVTGLSGQNLNNVSLRAHRGEVLGLGGLQGQGQSELLLTIFGALRAREGSITTSSGRGARIRHPRDAARIGIALVPGDRATQGMFAQRSIQENISIVSLARRLMAGVAISARRERAAAASMIDRLSIKIGRLTDPVSSLSGGNQQKVIIAKWLLNEPGIVLLDDPTKGVDVGAKAEIYALIRKLTRNGAAVIFNSSDDRELAEIADRVLVMYEGSVKGELDAEDVTYDNLVSSALLIGMGDQHRVGGDESGTA